MQRSRRGNVRVEPCFPHSGGWAAMNDPTSQTVHAAVPEGDARFYLRDPPEQVDDLLTDELAYAFPKAKHTPQYKDGWDGWVRLYSKRDHSAPIGLLDRTRTLLEEHGYALGVTVKGERSGDPIATSWDFENDLREYQERAVSAVLEQRGGIVAIPTGGGKTIVALRVVHAVSQRALILVHTKELLYQWSERVLDVLGVEPGLIGDGNWSEGPVTVAIMQTLVSRGAGKLEDGYGLAVFDECHRTSAAETMHNIGMAINVPLRVGLSATPWRRVDGEELKIEGATGGVAVDISAAELIDEGYLAEPEFRIIDPAEYGDQAVPQGGRWSDVYRQHIVLDAARNAAITHTTGELAEDGYSVLITVDQILHGVLLEAALTGDEPRSVVERLNDKLTPGEAEKVVSAVEQAAVIPKNAVFLCGTDSTERRQEILERFEGGDIDILVSTLIREGVDLPKLNAIVIGEGKKSEIARLQEIGRALRPAGGDHAVIVDVRDRGYCIGRHFEARREAFIDYYGRYGPIDADVHDVKAWLAEQDVPDDALLVYPEDERIVIQPGEYLGDEWDGYVSLMRSTDAIGYDPESQINYVRDPSRLPEPAERRAV